MADGEQWFMTEEGVATQDPQVAQATGAQPFQPGPMPAPETELASTGPGMGGMPDAKQLEALQKQADAAGLGKGGGLPGLGGDGGLPGLGGPKLPGLPGLPKKK